MQQVCSLSAWLEAIGLRLGPMRVLRPAGRDVERHASQYTCGFLSESAWENNCLEEFRLYLKVHEKSSEQNLAGMCLISGRWYPCITRCYGKLEAPKWQKSFFSSFHCARVTWYC